jgi:hypothetical protein
MIPLIKSVCEASAKASFQDTLMEIHITQRERVTVELAMIVRMQDEDAGDFVEHQAEAEFAAIQELALTKGHGTEALH